MRIVIKIGTSTLAHPTGHLNIRLVEQLCKVVSDMKNAGNEIILVSSGAIGMGVGFTLGLTLIALIREMFGAGTITLINLGDINVVFNVPGLSESPIRVLALSAGALLVMGYLKAFFNWFTAKNEKKAKEAK